MPQNKTESEVWSTLEEKIELPEAKTVVFQPWLKWAASIAVMVGIAATLLIVNPGTKTYSAHAVQEVSLPDGSTVSLNSEVPLPMQKIGPEIETFHWMVKRILMLSKESHLLFLP